MSYKFNSRSKRYFDIDKTAEGYEVNGVVYPHKFSGSNGGIKLQAMCL